MVKIRHVLYVVVIILLIVVSPSSFYAYNFLELDRVQQTPIADDINGVISLDKSTTIDAQNGSEKLVTAQNPLGVSQTVRIELLQETKWSFDDGTTTKEITLSSGTQDTFYVNVDEANTNDEEILDYNITAYSQNHELSKQESVQVINQVLNISGTVTAIGGSGKFSFDLTNEGDSNVTITGIGVDSTSSSAVEVSKGDIVTADGTQVVTQPIYIGGSTRNFTSPLLFQPNQVISFEFNRFLDSTGKNVNMRGESITVRFTFENYGDNTLVLNG